MLIRSSKISIDDSNIHGRGIFALDNIIKGEILEECHFFMVPRNLQYPQILMDHFFAWPKNHNPHEMVICLGYGSIFNHSDIPNADWETDMDKFLIRFIAIENIDAGQEIFTNYQKS